MCSRREPWHTIGSWRRSTAALVTALSRTRPPAAGAVLIRAHHAQLTRVLHPHREGAALLVGGHDFDPVVARERRPRPAHLVLALLRACGERQDGKARGAPQGSVADSSHGRPPG